MLYTVIFSDSPFRSMFFNFFKLAECSDETPKWFNIIKYKSVLIDIINCHSIFMDIINKTRFAILNINCDANNLWIRIHIVARILSKKFLPDKKGLGFFHNFLFSFRNHLELYTCIIFHRIINTMTNLENIFSRFVMVQKHNIYYF